MFTIELRRKCVCGRRVASLQVMLQQHNIKYCEYYYRSRRGAIILRDKIISRLLNRGS